MKNAIVLLLFLLFAFWGYAQSDEGKRTNYQFKQRVAFYTVDNRYNLKTDTIYHSFNGFHVWSDYDTVEINNVVYMIFRYYDFSSKFKNDTTFRPKPERWNSRLYGSKKSAAISVYDSIRSVQNSRYADSLARISKASMGKNPVHTDIYGKNGLLLAFPRAQFELLKLNGKIIDRYSLKFKNAISMTSGWLTVPFKFRPKRDTVNFNMTTDITLGAYFGPRLRIARYSNNYIVVPVTLGLSYINVGNSETSNVKTSGNSSVIPGITWSSGIIFDLNGFNIGFVAGQDFASGVGKGWIYNNKCWYSFSIGHSFLTKPAK